MKIKETLHLSDSVRLKDWVHVSRFLHIRNKLSYQYLLMLIWTFYSSASCLFWFSNLKRSYPVDGIMKLCDFMTVGLLFAALLIKLMINQRFRCKKVMTYMLFLGVVFVVELAIFNRDFAVQSLFMISFVSIDFRRFIRYDIKLKTVCLIFIILMCKVGIVQNFSGRFNGTFKQSLGFQHPNTFAMFCLVILLEWLYLRYRNAKLPELLFIFVFFFAVMKISPARTTGFTFILVYLLFLLAKYKPRFFTRKLVIYGMMLIGPVIGVFSVSITKMYLSHNSIAYQLNEIMTNRIWFQSQYWSAYPVRLFGGKIDTDSSVSVILDSGYIRCILTYGVVLSVLLCLLFSVLIYRASRQHQTGLVLMVVFFLMMGFAETAMLRLVINITFLAIFNRNCTDDKFVFPKIPILRRLFCGVKISV